MSAAARIRRSWCAGAAVASLAFAVAGCAHRSPAAVPRPPVLHASTFPMAEGGDVAAVLTATCEGCDWGVAGREAALLSLSVDGHYAQDVPLIRGGGPAE